MTKFRIPILILAVLAALMLAGCGDTTQESSVPEGIETFGTAVNPSAQPSTGEVVPSSSAALAVTDPNAPGVVGENDTSTSSTPSATTTSSPSTAPASTPTKRPSTSTVPASPSPSDDEDHPVISPPAPASTAGIDEAKAYIGKSLSSLFEDLGYSSSSDYEPIDEDDPDAGDIGTHYFDGFTVTTKRTSEGEIITAVNES